MIIIKLGSYILGLYIIIFLFLEAVRDGNKGHDDTMMFALTRLFYIYIFNKHKESPYKLSKMSIAESF